MFFPIAMNGACDIHFFLKKEDQIAYFHEKKKKCLPLFVEVDILGLSEIFCFVLHSCSIMIDQKNQYYTIIMKYFIVWVVVCVIPACCFFLDECLNEETSGGIFGKKKSEWIDCLCFFINILLVCCVFVVSWIGKIAVLFIVHVFLSFLIDSPGLLRSIEKLISMVFFSKSTNSFTNQLSSRINNRSPSWTNPRFGPSFR